MSVNDISTQISFHVNAYLLNTIKKPLLFWRLRMNQSPAKPKDGEIATYLKVVRGVVINLCCNL